MSAKKKNTKRSKSASLSPFRRIHKIVTENVEASVAMVSLLLNIFFLVGLVLYQTSPSFEDKIYRYTLTHHCAEQREGETQAIHDLRCQTGKFSPLYEKAVSDYKKLIDVK